MSRLTVLENEILPLVAKNSCLEYVGCENNAKNEDDSQANSTLMFLAVKMKGKQCDGDRTRVFDLPVIVKFQIDYPGVREWLKLDDMFHNEVLFYDTILPLLNRHNKYETIMFPKFYHGNATFGNEPDKDILILEDLRRDGYGLTEEKLFLDYEHIALAMKQLGRFHALSYAAKQKNNEEFFENMNRVVESRYGDMEYWTLMFKFGVKRIFQSLMAKDEYSSVMATYCDKIAHTEKLLQHLLRPEEPIAVFCHGDYCRNNVLYKYNEEGKPVDLKFFDLGMSRYSSPAVDLCFFLFMNATSEMRRKYWDEFLCLYHESLVSAVPGVVVPSLQDVHAEVHAKGFYAFMVCSFYLPVIASGMYFVATDLVEKTTEERAAFVLGCGGDEELQLLETLFVELVERKIIY